MDSAARPPVRLRDALAAVPDYVPGKPASATSGLTAYKVSSNENPYPPLPSVLRVVEKAAADLNRYPDMANRELIDALAAFVGVDPARIVVGAGSSGVLTQIVTALCEAGDEVVYAWRSFEMYPIVTGLAGARGVAVGLDADHRHRLDAMAAAVTELTKLVLICSPNNPTGPVVHDRELRLFLARVPSSVCVVIDEAYAEFVRDPDAPDAPALLEEHPNLVILRTFSKAYGLAGLRVGYAVASPELAAAFAKTAAPFAVNAIAQAAAVASLGESAELLGRVDAIVAERGRVARSLAEQGWRLPQSHANFVYFPLGEDTMAFAQACARAGLVVRPFAGDGVRVTIAEPEANDRLLDVAREFGPR